MEFWNWQEILSKYDNQTFYTKMGRPFSFCTLSTGIMINGRIRQSFDQFNDVLRNNAFSWNDMRKILDYVSYVYAILNDDRIQNDLREIGAIE